METFGKKGTFVGYSEMSKAYRIYVLGQRQIEVSRDVTFDEESTFRRSRESHIAIDMEEHEAPRAAKVPILDAPRLDIRRVEHDVRDDHINPTDLVEPVEPLERSRDAPPTKRRLTWL